MLKTTPHFWNLNEDSQLSRKVIHFIKPGDFQGYFCMHVMFSHRACLNCVYLSSPACFNALGSKRWRSGERTRLPPVWPGSHLCVDAICGLSLLLVLSFAPIGFSAGTPVFPSLQKPIFTNSNSTRNQVDEEPHCVLPPSPCLSFICYLCNVYTCV